MSEKIDISQDNSKKENGEVSIKLNEFSDKVPPLQDKDELPGNPKIRRWQTAVYCSAYVALGFLVGSLGPTILLLAQNVGQTRDGIGFLFSARGTGWVIGSILSGFGYKYVKGHILLGVVLLAQAVICFIIPFLTNFWTLLSAASIGGLCGAFVDVGTNSLLVVVWRHKVGPLLQFLHFFFAIGSALAPFGIALVFTLASSNQLFWSYCFIAIGMTLIGLFPFFVPSPSLESASHGTIRSDVRRQCSRECFHYWGITFIMSFYLLIYVGAEVSYGGWIFAYAVEVYNMEDSLASYLTSVFWFAITIGRLLAVPIAAKFSTKAMLIVNMIGCIMSLSVLVFFSDLKSEVLLWTMTASFGLFMASIFATAYSLPQDLGIELNSTAAAILIAGSSIGDISIPWFVGMLWTHYGQSVLLISELTITLMELALYFVVVYGVDKFLKSKPTSTQIELKHLQKEQKTEFISKDENKNNSNDLNTDSDEETVKFTAFEIKENES
jgi:FHS family Na+ dependent glucose MFS transporter 1